MQCGREWLSVFKGHLKNFYESLEEAEQEEKVEHGGAIKR